MASEQPNPPTAKLQDTSANTSGAPAGVKPQQPKAPVPLEEDDEFEDFPVEDWPNEETEGAGGTAANTGEGNAHLWEESWDDDDDASEDFSQQLKEEIEKVKAGK